jgi:tetratricopeptide (TPR) repeat protein
MRFVSTLFLFAILAIFSCNNKKQVDSPTPAPRDSLSIFLEKVKTDSLDPALWQKIYQLQLDKGDTSMAISALRNYTLLVPEDGNGWLEFAWLLADTKDPRALLVTDSLKKVKDPEISARAAFISGVYYSNIGKDDRALAVFDSIITSNYTYLDAYIEKGIIEHDKKQYANALKTFQQAMKVNSSTAEIYFWISKCYEGLGNKGEAEDWKKKYEALR